MLAQARVAASISDIVPLVQERVGIDGPWQQEWVQEVQTLLAMDAGWGWQGFWETVRRNILVSLVDFPEITLTGASTGCHGVIAPATPSEPDGDDCRGKI